MRRLPPTSALEAFLVTARSGTLKTASEELNLSVSALSRRIQNMEAYIGQILFHRQHHEFKLTAAGKRLQSGMEPVFDQLGLLMEEVRDEGQYHLHIGVPSVFATVWLMPRLNRFRQQYPEVELHLDSSGSPMAKLGLSLDAIVFFANRDEHPIDIHAIRPQRAFGVTAPNLLDKNHDIGEAFQEHTLLLHSRLPEILPNWMQAMGYQEISNKRIEYFDDGALLVSAAENGLGIALVLEDMVNFYPRQANITQPFEEYVQTPYSYCFATKSASGSPKALAWFRSWLLEEVQMDKVV